MITVLINDTVKKYLLKQSKNLRKKIRNKFEFLEAGIWEGRLRVKKIKSISSKCVFEVKIDKGNSLLFTLGNYGDAAGKFLVVYVWGVVAHDDSVKKSRNIIPENVPFLRFHDYEEVLLKDIDMEEMKSSYFTQEHITEKTKDESGSQRWYPVDVPEWKRIQLYTRDDFELFLYLTLEQKNILRTCLPIMVSGTAGSGKTTLSVYYLLNKYLSQEKKIFVTYNKYLKNFAERLYRGLLNEREWKNEVIYPNFYVFKELNLEIAKKYGKIFSQENEVDFNHFSKMIATHPMHHKFDSALVWEEIRSIIKGALPQLDISILERAFRAIRNNEINSGLIKQLQKQFILFSKLESLKEIDRFVSKYLKINISSFSARIEKYIQEENYKDRVLLIIDKTINTLKKQKKAVEKKYLSFLEYELLGKKKAPNFKFNRREIYNIFEWYQDSLECDNMWDELDLTREVIKIYSEKNLENYTYDILACDEVQDFTDIQIDLMFYMVRNPNNVFFAGDTKQTINPSGFRWEEVKRHFYERGLDVPELKYLSLNFRSSGSIVELSNILLGLKEKYLGIKAEELKEEWRYKGRPAAVVSGINESDMLEILKAAGARRTVVVRTETEKKRLNKILETELLFTMAEAKGLEFDTVVLWKFCDDQFSKDVWKVILDMSKRSIHEAKIKHEINLLYVGITRSQKDLIIYDGKKPSFIWENPQFKNNVYITDDRSFIDGIWNVISTPEEWIEQGHYFFEKEYYKAAMECFKNGGDLKLLSKASAYCYEKEGKYLDAALNFEKIGVSIRAAHNYEKAGEFKKALSLWEKLKNKERVFNCQIEIYKLEGKFHKAGSLYLEKRMYEETIKCFKKSKDYREIAEIYLKNLKNIKEAANFFEYSHDYEKAARLYNRLKSYDKAAELYFRGLNYLKAEDLWKKTKNIKSLIELYSKTGQDEKLFKIYEKQKNFEKTTKCLKAFKDKSHLVKEAEELFSKRKYFQALVRFCVMDNHKRTGECYLRMKRYEDAVKHFKLAEDYYSAGNTYYKIKDYKKALENYLNSEEDRKNDYSMASKLTRRICDDQWIYKLGQEFFNKEKYHGAAVLFSVFSNTFREVGTCYALMRDTKKAFKTWRNCERTEDYERIADICISRNIIEIGAKFFLNNQKKVMRDFDWSYSLNLKNNRVLNLLDIYFAKNQDSEEMRVWGNFLGNLDFNGKIWEKTLYYLERGGDYNFLIEHFDRLKLVDKREFKGILAKFKKDIPGLKRSNSWENLALRYIFFDNIDELNRVIPKIKINEHNYVFYLIGEKKYYEKGVAWCLKNNLLNEAGRLLRFMRRYERAAEVFEKDGNLIEAADYYGYSGQMEKCALLFRKLKRFLRAGDAFYKMGDFRNALKMYEKQTPQNKKKIAKTYERLGDFEKALSLWNKIGDRRAVERCLGKLEKTKQRELQFPKLDKF